MFSCEFCEISKNIFSYRTPLVAAPRRTLTDPPGDERLQNKRLRIVKEEDAQQWSLPKKLYSNENETSEEFITEKDIKTNFTRGTMPCKSGCR